MQVNDDMVRAAAEALFNFDGDGSPVENLSPAQKEYWFSAASAALTASLSHMWRSIEEAPKDGTRVLLVEADQQTEVCTGWWDGGEWRDYGDIGCNGVYDYRPTHYMPLPSPPNTGGE